MKRSVRIDGTFRNSFTEWPKKSNELFTKMTFQASDNKNKICSVQLSCRWYNNMQAFLTEDKMCCHKTAWVFVPHARCNGCFNYTVTAADMQKRKNCLLWQLSAPHCAPIIQSLPPQWHCQKVPLRGKRKRKVKWCKPSRVRARIIYITRHRLQHRHWLHLDFTSWRKLF